MPMKVRSRVFEGKFSILLGVTGARKRKVINRISEVSKKVSGLLQIMRDRFLDKGWYLISLMLKDPNLLWPGLWPGATDDKNCFIIDKVVFVANHWRQSFCKFYLKIFLFYETTLVQVWVLFLRLNYLYVQNKNIPLKMVLLLDWNFVKQQNSREKDWKTFWKPEKLITKTTLKDSKKICAFERKKYIFLTNVGFLKNCPEFCIKHADIQVNRLRGAMILKLQTFLTNKIFFFLLV